MELEIVKSNWKKFALKDVLFKREENDKENAKNRFDRFLKVDHFDKECIHVKRWSSQESGEELNPTFYKIFRKGQILFPTRNPHLRRTVLASFDGICGEKTLTLEANEEYLIPEFIPFLFHSESFYAHTTAAIIGSTNPHVRWRDVANYEFLLPPIDQQAQLAELLWAMDEVIEREKEVLFNLNIQLGALNVLFFSKTNKKLGDIINSTISGGTPDTKINEFYINGSIPWITTTVLDSHFISNGEKLITQEAINNSAAKILPSGNILAGTRVGVGKFSINKIDISFSQDITGLLINLDRIDSEFLVHQLNSHIFKQRLEPYIRGTTIKGITKSDLLNIKIYSPTRNIQIEIKTKLSLLNESQKEIGNKITTSQSLQKSLINQIFG